MKTPGPRSSWRPPSNSTATSAAISQGPQLKSLSIPLSIKLALKLHAHSVHYGYKLVITGRALEKTPSNSHHQDQAPATSRSTASNPPILLLLLLVMGIHGASALGLSPLIA
eukprot:944932-Pelagomonas_calceolata.AAC.1